MSIAKPNAIATVATLPSEGYVRTAQIIGCLESAAGCRWFHCRAAAWRYGSRPAGSPRRRNSAKSPRGRWLLSDCGWKRVLSS